MSTSLKNLVQSERYVALPPHPQRNTNTWESCGLSVSGCLPQERESTQQPPNLQSIRGKKCWSTHLNLHEPPITHGTFVHLSRGVIEDLISLHHCAIHWAIHIRSSLHRLNRPKSLPAKMPHKYVAYCIRLVNF